MHDALPVNAFTSCNIMFTSKGKRKKGIGKCSHISNKSVIYNTRDFLRDGRMDAPE